MHLVEDQRRLRRRTLIVAYLAAGFCTLGLFGVMGRVAMLRWMPQPPLVAEAARRFSSHPLHARRGTITDRRGRPLAVTRYGYKLFVDPGIIDDFSEFAAHLAHALDANPAEIDQQIGMNAERRYVVINKLLSEPQAQAVRELELRGAALDPRPVRHYAAGDLAGQVVGFVGAEHRGMDGIEFACDQRLRGDSGRLRYLRDARRRVLWVDENDYTPPTHGSEVRLSIDLVVQQIAQQELLTTVEKYSPKTAEVVVLHARSGQVLAMVNWPYYNPNDRGNAPPAVRRNRCVTDPYEPGSIFKPFVHSAVTAAAVAHPDDRVDTTTSGAWRTDFGRILHDASAHGTLTWDMVLIKSSNIGMGKMGLKLGARRMHEAVRRFGFGSSTGSGLPGESPGIVNPLRQWNLYSQTSVPMGQEIAVTPLQMARAFTAFANHGKIVQPSIHACDALTPKYTAALNPDVADHTRQVLRRVITEGTGKKANSKLYRIFGKTGTAQVPSPDRRGYLPRTYTGSFICGAPLANPQIVVIVVVHQPDPDKGYYGGIVAAPVAMRIVERTLPYLGIPPDVPDARSARVASFPDDSPSNSNM